jgi:tripartite-type tricarboxylate transporter receptor subunit TctC
MKRARHQRLHLAAGAAALSLLSMILPADGAGSQTARTIKIIVPFAPGGATDSLARVLAEQVTRAQGPTMVVENRPGAGSIIGTEAVSRAAPDGNTVLLVSNSFLINAQLRKQNYDPLTSFEPICHLVKSPQLIVVNGSSPHRTLANLVDAARAKPGQLTMASIGPGSTQHIAFELFKRTASVDMTFVPYTAAAPVLNALLGEHVTSAFADYATTGEQLKARKLRALATASRTRIEPLPDVPTVAESGYPDYEVEVWYGLVVPAKTPKDSVSQLTNWFAAALQVPEVKGKLEAMGLYPVGICGAEFAAHIRTKYEEYGRIIREANIKAE